MGRNQRDDAVRFLPEPPEDRLLVVDLDADFRFVLLPVFDLRRLPGFLAAGAADLSDAGICTVSDAEISSFRRTCSG